MSLADKIRAARETWATVEGHDFLVRCPTMLQLLKLKDMDNVEVIRTVIVGWRRVREIDLFPGGVPTEAAFDADALVEWATDRPSIYVGLVNAIHAEIARRTEQMEAAEKRDIGPGRAGDVAPLRRPGPKSVTQRPERGSGSGGVASDGTPSTVGSG